MVTTKKSMLEKAVVSLSQDADKYAMDAESKVNAMESKELIAKSNSFRKTVIEMREIIKERKRLVKGTIFLCVYHFPHISVAISFVCYIYFFCLLL